MFKGQRRGPEYRCSFCGKMQAEDRRLVAGPGVYICNECVELCRQIIDLENAQPGKSGTGVGVKCE